MTYLLMLYGVESEGETPSQMSDDTARAWADYRLALQRDGVLVDWAGLHPTGTARTVRVRDGETLVTDGPFAETREQLGGFFVLDCSSVEQAAGYAARMPCAPAASIEIRAFLEPPLEAVLTGDGVGGTPGPRIVGGSGFG